MIAKCTKESDIKLPEGCSTSHTLTHAHTRWCSRFASGLRVSRYQGELVLEAMKLNQVEQVGSKDLSLAVVVGEGILPGFQ